MIQKIYSNYFMNGYNVLFGKKPKPQNTTNKQIIPDPFIMLPSMLFWEKETDAV